jgi:acyl-CoA dehydrogenase
LESSAENYAFRDQVRAFLAENLSEELREAGRLTTSIISDHDASQAWQKVLYRQGWAAPSWPREHGGTGWTPMQQHIFAVECALADVPIVTPTGLAMVGPAIMGHGNDEQKAHYLPRILSAEDNWCQGYSEPGSGSDLASLQTRAVPDGEDYLINGSKIWTTNAHNANRMFCLVRTSNEGKPQEGISFILIDMASPGIRVEPIITLAGNHELNQVFFEDVRVPRENLVGAENDGWTVAKYLLEFERGGRAWGARLRGAHNRLSAIAEARGLTARAAFARALADLEVRLTAMEYTEHRVIADIVASGRPGPASSLLKLQAATVMQGIDELAVDAVAYYAAPHQPAARQPGSNVEPIGEPDGVAVMARYLDQRARSIAGGTNEIQRNIMAKLVLGM